MSAENAAIPGHVPPPADGSPASPYDFKKMLFAEDIYDTIELDGIEPDLQGWGSNHGLFGIAIQKLRPLTIVELGTWKGASAVHMADLCKKEGLNAQILCVDNWIGFPSFYLRPEQAHKEFKMKGGIPRLFWTFMKNVVEAGHQDMITPLVQQTYHAAQILRSRRVQADLIYVDGDHTYEGCKADLDQFEEIVAPNGVFLCDDYQWEGAKRAIDEYHERTGCQRVIAGNKVLMAKSRDLSEIGEIIRGIEERRAAAQRRKEEAEAKGAE